MKLRRAIAAKYVRKRNREVKNIYRPCPIIDRPQILRDVLEKFHPTPSQEGAEKIKSILADGLDEYAVSLKKVMDPVWQREFPEVRETVDDALHVGEHGRRLLKQEASAEPRREARAAATR